MPASPNTRGLQAPHDRVLHVCLTLQVAWGRPLKLQWAQHRSGSGGAPGEGAQQQSFDVFVGDLARDVDETVSWQQTGS